MNTVKELITTLTEEELEQHKELIEECLEREADTLETCKQIRENMERIAVAAEKIMDNLELVRSEVDKIYDNSLYARENIMAGRLKNMTDDMFFKA
jgi:hypothetical protein